MGQALRIIEGSRRTWAGLGQDGLYVPAAIRCKPPTGIPPTMHPTKDAAAAAAMASLADCSTAGTEALRLSNADGPVVNRSAPRRKS